MEGEDGDVHGQEGPLSLVAGPVPAAGHGGDGRQRAPVDLGNPGALGTIPALIGDLWCRGFRRGRRGWSSVLQHRWYYLVGTAQRAHYGRTLPIARVRWRPVRPHRRRFIRWHTCSMEHG